MRWLPVLSALLMPLIAWQSNAGAFGPTNGEISGRYPTLLIAAGYAFSIWGLIFALDIAFGVWQWRRDAPWLRRARAYAAVGFALTAAWMPVFSQQWFWLALAVIWLALAALVLAAREAVRGSPPVRGQAVFARLPLSMHAGWLSLAAFLNTAQVIVAYRLLPVTDMLPWSLVLYGLATVLLLGVNALLRGATGFVAAVLWGLVAVYAEQSRLALRGADVAAWVALAIALVVVAQTVWLVRGQPAPGDAKR